MERIIVFGVRHFDFMDDTGKNVKGYSLYCMEKDRNVYGMNFVKNSALIDALSPEDFSLLTDTLFADGTCECEVSFNRKGKITYCRPV